MKTVLTICACLLLLTEVEAQKKPNISKAKTLLEQGALAEAKAMIDEATTYEKTMNDGKTWYYRGLIYAAIDTTSNPMFSGLKEGALETSLASFKKADDLGDPDKEYFIYGATAMPTTKSQHISGYYTFYFNKGIAAYQDEDFENSSKSFETASIIIPGDTAAFNNAAYGALAYEDYDRALVMFQKSVDAGAKSFEVYNAIIGIYRLKEDENNALTVIRKAKKFYPVNNELNRLEISILISQGKQEEALLQLGTAITNEPTDPVLRYALGILYEELKDVGNAKIAYKQALEIDPNHFPSNFNLAVILFNEANALYKAKGLLGYSAADQKKAKDMEPLIKAGFTKALPAWEKVYSIKPMDRSALDTLLFLYAYMGEEKKADKVEKELIALGDDGN